MKSHKENIRYENQQQFDPYQNPPDFKQAENHRRASLIGIIKKNKIQQMCLCCYEIIQKQLLDLRCHSKQLIFLGGPIYFYFQFLKLIIVILLLISIPNILYLSYTNNQFNCCQFQQFYKLQEEYQYNIGLSISFIIIITIFIYLIRRFYIFTDFKLFKDIVGQQNFTICTSNLPHCSQEELKDWFWNNYSVKPIKYSMAYEIEEIQQAKKRREQLTILKNKRNLTLLQQKYNNLNESLQIDYTYKNICEEINLIDSKIRKFKLNLDITLKQAGLAFVTLKDTKIVTQFIKKQKINKNNTKITLFKQNQIRFSYSPNPSDIIWHHLLFQNSFSPFLLNFICYSLGFIILFLTLWSLSILNNQTNNEFIKCFYLFMGYMFYHLAINFLIQSCTILRKKMTKTKQQIGYLKFYTLFYTVYICFLPFFIYKNEQSQQFFINLVLILDSFSHPIIKLFNYQDIYKKAKLQYIKNLQKTNNPYTQQYINKIIEGRDFKIGQNLHILLKSIFVCFFYMQSVPLCITYYSISLSINYWIQKYLLLRQCKTPPKYQNKLNQIFLTILGLSPISLSLGKIINKIFKQNTISISNFVVFCFTLLISLSLWHHFQYINNFSISQKNKQYYSQAHKFTQMFITANPMSRDIQILKNKRHVSPQKILTSPQFDFYATCFRDQEEAIKQQLPVKKGIIKKRIVNRLLSIVQGDRNSMIEIKKYQKI